MYVCVLLPDELHVPLDVCGAVVKREFDYWSIDDRLIKSCCWISYSSYIDQQETLTQFNQSIEYDPGPDDKTLAKLSPWRRKQMEIWLLLDHPRSSTLAMVGSSVPLH